MTIAKEQLRQIISQSDINSVADIYSLLKGKRQILGWLVFNYQLPHNEYSQMQAFYSQISFMFGQMLAFYYRIMEVFQTMSTYNARVPADQQYQLIMECWSSGLMDYQWCKAHGLHPYSYLKYLLDSRPSTDTSDAELANLAPWSEKARIACSNKSE